RYRNADDPRVDYTIGCILLEQPFFLAERDWIAAPSDWKGNIVRGKGYDATSGEGRRLWEQVQVATGGMAAVVIPPLPYQPEVVAERYGKPTIVYPRLGQGTFRVVVTDIYDRRCAVTRERTLPVLEAAHIRPYQKEGPHD